LAAVVRLVELGKAQTVLIQLLLLRPLLAVAMVLGHHLLVMVALAVVLALVLHMELAPADKVKTAAHKLAQMVTVLAVVVLA
jgi:hypothetical protein